MCIIDSGETEAKKKPFSFGLVTDPKVFNFGGPASTNGPSTTFVFGAASNGLYLLSSVARSRMYESGSVLQVV